jgi:hypothetical protein
MPCSKKLDARSVGTAAAFALLVLACSQSDPARGAAERFIDAYYVEIDLPRAREQTVGLAQAKVDDEMKLLEGQAAADGTSRPTVNYRFVEQQDASNRDRRGFIYELTITFDGRDQIKRRTLVTVREDDGVWRAANFQEID